MNDCSAHLRLIAVRFRPVHHREIMRNHTITHLPIEPVRLHPMPEPNTNRVPPNLGEGCSTELNMRANVRLQHYHGDTLVKSVVLTDLAVLYEADFEDGEFVGACDQKFHPEREELAFED